MYLYIQQKKSQRTWLSDADNNHQFIIHYAKYKDKECARTKDPTLHIYPKRKKKNQIIYKNKQQKYFISKTFI